MVGAVVEVAEVGGGCVFKAGQKEEDCAEVKNATLAEMNTCKSE